MAIRASVLRAEPLCMHCKAAGRINLASEVDHIKPLAKGGTDDPKNLQGLCKEHHAVKSARDEGKARRPAIGVDGWPLADMKASSTTS